MLASLVFDAVLSVPADKRVKPISVVCTDTRVEIPAIVEMVEGTLDKMHPDALLELPVRSIPTIFGGCPLLVALFKSSGTISVVC